ncbi:MAG: YdeI/OmpD-associated family protein [Oscillospiraceae bacterium]|nr:YdeI/OmpD-associated family protein [Oscillospiraceae bacterium]
MQPFIGMGGNPDGPDLPMGFGMHLAQNPQALEAYGNMTYGQRTRVVEYIQAAVTGEDSANRIANAIQSLRENDLRPFGL